MAQRGRPPKDPDNGKITAAEKDAYIANVIRTKHLTKMNARSWSNDDLVIRDEIIYHEMGLGKSTSQICYDLSERWGCHFQTVMKYVSEAKKRLIETNRENPESFKQKMMEKLERLAKDAEAHNDRKTMLAVYAEMNKLNNMYTTKVEADVKETITFEFGE